MNRPWIFVPLLLSCAGNSPAQAGAGNFGAEIDRLRIRYNIPGLSGLLVREDSTLWEAGLGVRDLARSLPVTPETRFHLASLTKPFAAVLVLQLVAEGKLRLEQPVTDFGVTLEAEDTVRVEHLLSHTSEGLPGSRFRYNGARFGRLDRVLEGAGGAPFARLFEERIQGPLGLWSTIPNREQDSALARGYDFSRAGRNLPVDYPRHFSPAAGMLSTARDLAAFSRALAGDRLLTGSWRERMFTPRVTPAGDTLPYALGWFVQRYRGEIVHWHYGYWTGNSSLIVRIPSRRITFVLLANNEMLSAPFNLGAGRVTSSPFAEALLRTVVR